jgi:hypothetical protein
MNHTHLLASYLTYDQPFGPEDTSEVGDPYCRRMLYHSLNRIHQSSLADPTIIIGRKGSGKTAILQSSRISGKYKIVLELGTPSAMGQIMNTFRTTAPAPAFAETVAQLWTILLWMPLIHYFAKLDNREGPANRVANTYFSALVGDFRTTAAVAIETALTTLSAHAGEGSAEGFPARASQLKLDGIDFEQVKASIIADLDKVGWTAILLIDSLDNYDFGTAQIDRAIQGLLKCAGSFNTGPTPYKVRLCLPSELYPSFLSLSANPAKDFSRCMMVRWRASELLILAAHRLSLFITSHPATATAYEGSCNGVLFDKKDTAMRLLSLFFPETVTNRRGDIEPTFSYILRHTQLVPRHFLLLLNSIFRASRAENGRKINFGKVSEEAVRNGILAKEEILCSEITTAFRHSYPDSTQFLQRCIPHLPQMFRQGEMHTVFNERGKFGKSLEDLHSFQAMLTSMGILGKRLSVSGTYINTLFQYSAAHPVQYGPDDDLCLHPIIMRVFGAKRSAGAVIYPYGTDPDNIEESESYVGEFIPTMPRL